MKRCPQCHFIYPDSDSTCDFDQSNLVEAAESEIAAITNTPARPALSDLAATHSKKFAIRKSRKALPIAAVLGLVIGVVVFGVYFAVQRQMKPQQPVQQVSSPVTSQPVVAQMPGPSSSPSTTESPSPEEPSSAAKTTASPSKARTSHSTSTLGPVSTNSPAAGKEAGTKSVILLTSGGKVEADEVWRTKDGIWYRRDGVVTLLKKNRVKAIVSK